MSESERETDLLLMQFTEKLVEHTRAVRVGEKPSPRALAEEMRDIAAARLEGEEVVAEGDLIKTRHNGWSVYNLRNVSPGRYVRYSHQGDRIPVALIRQGEHTGGDDA